MRRRRAAATGGRGRRRRTSRRSPRRRPDRSPRWTADCSREPSLPCRWGGVPRRPAPEPPASVPGVLHPVGKLPAAVYWRRRGVLLLLVLGVLGAGAWFGIPLLDAGDTASGASTATASRPVPALER